MESTQSTQSIFSDTTNLTNSYDNLEKLIIY